MVLKQVDQILKHYKYDSADIIAILQDVQEGHRFLPQDVLTYIADKVNISLSRIYHLATFFKAFSLEPRGRHVLHVCMGTACHVRGAPRILDAVERSLKIKAGTTASDMSYTLETVNCIGACAMGPVVVVDGRAQGKMNSLKAERMLQRMKEGEAGEAKPVVVEKKEAKGKVVQRRPRKQAAKKIEKPHKKKKPVAKVRARASRTPKRPAKRARR